MTTLLNWLSPSAMQSLGWALLHFLWQGTALAALAAAAMALCRRASARYLLGVGALVLMLLAPLATFFCIHSNIPVWQTPRSRRRSPRPSQLRGTEPRRVARRSLSSLARSPFAPSLDALPWLVEAWLLGVAFFSLRSAGGFLLLERERRRQSSVVSPRVLEICYALQDQLGIGSRHSPTASASGCRRRR